MQCHINILNSCLTAQWRPPVESIWTDNVIRSPTWNPPLPTPLNGLASMNSMYGLYSGRALYDSSILDANAPDPSQRERFATYQLRRLDTACYGQPRLGRSEAMAVPFIELVAMCDGHPQHSAPAEAALFIASNNNSKRLRAR